jgi:hypothetical protein
MHDEALRIIEQLAELDVDGRQVTQLQGEQIAAMFGGNMSLFIELDERPGQYDPGYASGDWHWKLRQARNGCSRFFDVFNETGAQRKLRELREDCEYHEEDEGSVDALIEYKNALEDQVGVLWPRADAWDRIDEALRRNARGESHASAADVCAVGFALQEKVSNG